MPPPIPAYRSMPPPSSNYRFGLLIGMLLCWWWCHHSAALHLVYFDAPTGCSDPDKIYLEVNNGACTTFTSSVKLKVTCASATRDSMWTVTAHSSSTDGSCSSPNSAYTWHGTGMQCVHGFFGITIGVDCRELPPDADYSSLPLPPQTTAELRVWGSTTCSGSPSITAQLNSFGQCLRVSDFSHDQSDLNAFKLYCATNASDSDWTLFVFDSNPTCSSGSTGTRTLQAQRKGTACTQLEGLDIGMSVDCSKQDGFPIAGNDDSDRSTTYIILGVVIGGIILVTAILLVALHLRAQRARREATFDPSVAKGQESQVDLIWENQL